MTGLKQLEAEQVRSLDIFKNLSEDALNVLANVGYAQKLTPGTLLTNEGQLPIALYVPIQGIIELFSSHDDRETTLTLVRRGRSYSLGAIMAREPYMESSRSLVFSTVFSFPIEAVHNLIASDQSFASAMSDELISSTRRYLRELKNQKLRTSLERLAAWILKTDLINGNTGRFRIEFGKKTLASHLGMTPENLSRTFSFLKENGIQMSGREILIVRRPALEKIAKLSHMID